MKKLNVSRARELRRTNTDAEALLWRYLRSRNLGGHKFVRQEPIGAHIADFVCRSRKLVVELDGRHHDSQMALDAARTAALQRLGYKVIRFSNADVIADVEGVVLQIKQALGCTPLTLTLSPEGRGDQSRSHGR